VGDLLKGIDAMVMKSRDTERTARVAELVDRALLALSRDSMSQCLQICRGIHEEVAREPAMNLGVVPILSQEGLVRFKSNLLAWVADARATWMELQRLLHAMHLEKIRSVRGSGNVEDEEANLNTHVAALKGKLVALKEFAKTRWELRRDPHQLRRISDMGAAIIREIDYDNLSIEAVKKFIESGDALMRQVDGALMDQVHRDRVGGVLRDALAQANAASFSRMPFRDDEWQKTARDLTTKIKEAVGKVVKAGTDGKIPDLNASISGVAGLLEQLQGVVGGMGQGRGGVPTTASMLKKIADGTIGKTPDRIAAELDGVCRKLRGNVKGSHAR
jgi:hypothetical protein